jgi:hypothetical protein
MIRNEMRLTIHQKMAAMHGTPCTTQPRNINSNQYVVNCQSTHVVPSLNAFKRSLPVILFAQSKMTPLY